MDTKLFDMEEIENQVEDWAKLDDLDKDFMISQIEILLTEYSGSR